MQGERQLDHAKVCAEVPAGLGDRVDDHLTYLIGKLAEGLSVQPFQISGRGNPSRRRKCGPPHFPGLMLQLRHELRRPAFISFPPLLRETPTPLRGGGSLRPFDGDWARKRSGARARPRWERTFFERKQERSGIGGNPASKHCGFRSSRFSQRPSATSPSRRFPLSGRFAGSPRARLDYHLDHTVIPARPPPRGTA